MVARDSKKKYSIVIPFYNEEDSVKPLYKSVKKAMDGLEKPYEMIFVNDGSTDKTVPLLEKIASNDLNVVLVHTKERSGQTKALKLGFEKASGDVIVSMDGDMQNDPADIPGLVKELDKGYDFVCGWRYPRHDPISKKIASKFGNLVQGNVFKSHLHDISCTLRAYTKETIKVLPLKREGAHRFIPYLLVMKSKRPSEVKVHHLARQYGKTKYGFSRSFIVAYDFLTLIFNSKTWL